VLNILQSAGQPLTLTPILNAVDAQLGPFEVNIQWIGPTLAHLNQQVADGNLRKQTSNGIRTWQAN